MESYSLNMFAPFGDKYLCFFAILKSHSLRVSVDYLSRFGTLLRTWPDLNQHNPSMPVSTDGAAAILSIKDRYSYF